MLIIMGSRAIYYLVMHFNIENGLDDKPVDNNYLIAIYLQEIIFNFVVFYNLVLKQGHEEKHFEKEYKRATTRVNIRGRPSLSGELESEESIK